MAARSLVVAIEQERGVELDPGVIRSAIARELGRPTVPPSHAAAARDADAVLVANAADRIVVSLRGSPDRWMSRSVRTAADAPTRVRLIAWLVGNLGRDPQGLMPTAEASRKTAQPTPHEVSVAAPERTEPERAPPIAPTEPPPVASELAIAAQPIPPARSAWQVGLLWKTAYSNFGASAPNAVERLSGWQAQVIHAADDGRLFGGEMNLGPGAYRVIGLGGTMGKRWHSRRLSCDAGVAAGVEVVREQVSNVTDSSTEGLVLTRTTGMRPAFYVHPAVVGAFRLFDQWDAVAELGAHLSTSEMWSYGLTGLLGVRVGL